jgi:membrane protease YdiL (CAAX protease family)
MPTLVAIALIAAAEGGRGLLDIWRTIATWRLPLWPTLAAFALPQITCLLAFQLFRVLGGATPALVDWKSSVVFTLVLLPLTAFFEEVGWRHLLFRELQEQMTPLSATAVVAVTWGLWHLPMYLHNNAEGDRTGLLFVLFMVGVLPVTAFASWFYNRAGGRLLPVMLFHASLDASIGFYFGSLPKGELRPFGYWVGTMWACSSLLYWRIGRTLGRGSAAAGGDGRGGLRPQT